MRRIGVVVTVLLLTFIMVGCSNTTTNASVPARKTTSRVTNKYKRTPTKKGQKIFVIVRHHRLKAHLNRSSAAKAFAREIPLALKFRDYVGLPEKIADLGHPLPTKGMPSGHAGNRGAIGYWSPQKRIVFYWGTEQYYEGIHIIGHFDTSQYRHVIKNMGNRVPVKIVRAH